MELVKIPHERIKALRGDADATLQMLMLRMKVSMTVDEDGGVELDGEPIDEFFAKEVVRAIGRGFEPRIALKLLKDDYAFHLIDLRDFAYKPDQMARIKGRVIGEKGKAKKIIEEEGEVDLAIYGHTVGIIGSLDVIGTATDAVFKLIEGKPHSAVYLYLEKIKRKRKQEEMVELRSGKMTKK